MSEIVTHFRVNGAPCAIDAPAERPLLDVLRGPLALTGTKRGCDVGECGACNVMINGVVVRSCLTLAAELSGCDVVTIEGLGSGFTPGTIQQAFVDAGAIQCGFCMSGMIVAATGLLARNPAPSAAEIRAGLAGNLCRCSGYVKVIDAVLLAAARAGGRAA
jgi:carbon-monoxide dehydrogenase small subunit